jgi:putative lumazine-binding protein
MSLEAASEHPAPDRDQILRVVRLYTDGFGARNPAMFREAFHPSARISWQTPGGQVHDALIADDFDRKPPEGWANWNVHITGRILTVF